MMTLKNDFHRTEINLEPVATGETKHGEQCAEFSEEQIHQAAMTLCGIKDCTCHKFLAYCEDEDGKQYLVVQR